MEKVINFIKNYKILLIIIIIILILGGIGILFINNKNKEYCLYEVSEYKYFALNKDNNYGIIDANGNIIIEPIYDNVKIPNPEKPVFICEKENEVIILNENSEEIYTEYDEVNAISIRGIVSNVPYEKKILKYKKNGKYGLIDYNGKVITQPIYEEIRGLQNKESELLVKKDEKYGVINSKGFTIIKAIYDNIEADGFYTEADKYGLSGYIVCNKTTDGYRYGYIDYKHKKVLDVQYNKIGRVLEYNNNDICLIVCKNGQYGVITNNKIILDYSYQGIEYEGNNKIFIIQRNTKYGVTDIKGKVILPVEYADIIPQGLYIEVKSSDNEDSKYFDLEGNEIQNRKYTYVQKVSQNYFITTDEERMYGIADSLGNEIVKNKYSYIEYLFNDYYIASNDEGYIGVINSKDEKVIEFKYEVLQKIEGTNIIEAKSLKDNITEIYSNNMKKVYSESDASVYFEDKYIKISSKNNITYFDFDGKKINASDALVNNNIFANKSGDKWGFIDRNGNVIVDYEYNLVTEFNSFGYAGIMKDNKWGVINKEGNIVLKPFYDKERFNAEPEFLGEYYRVYYGYGESYFTNN